MRIRPVLRCTGSSVQRRQMGRGATVAHLQIGCSAAGSWTCIVRGQQDMKSDRPEISQQIRLSDVSQRKQACMSHTTAPGACTTHHLHDERPAGAHLHIPHIEAKLQRVIPKGFAFMFATWQPRSGCSAPQSHCSAASQESTRCAPQGRLPGGMICRPTAVAPEPTSDFDAAQERLNVKAAAVAHSHRDSHLASNHNDLRHRQRLPKCDS